MQAFRWRRRGLPRYRAYPHFPSGPGSGAPVPAAVGWRLARGARIERARDPTPVIARRAAALLERDGAAAHEREPLRVRVAALKYPEEMTQPTWGLALPEVERIRAADRAQYLAWLAEHGDS
jgi:hypothetical protein